MSVSFTASGDWFIFDDNGRTLKHTLRKLEERSFAPAPPRSPHRT